MNSRTALMRGLVILGIVSLVFLSGCGGSTASTVNNQPPPPPSPAGVTVAPSSTTVQPGGVQQFTATVTPSGANQAITWSVSGAGCTGASCGAIDSTGKYTAPASVPNPPTVTVKATSVADATKAATAAVTISTAGDNPFPTITSLIPAVGPVGGPAFILRVVGSNFVLSSVVRWNGSDRPTVFLGSGLLNAQIAAGDITATGTAAITVFNPAPGGGTSNAVTFSISTTVNPVSVAVAADPSGKFGKFAYVANAGSNNVSMYTIDATTGALTSTGTVAAGTRPLSVAVDPSGKFAYVANADSHNISMYTIDGNTGALTSTGTVAAGTGPVSVAVDPSGKFAYVANLGSNNVSMYAIDGTTGALTSTGMVAAGTSPSVVAVHPSGKFAYVTNSDQFSSDDVSMYTIDATTGTLSSIGTTAPGSAGPGPCSMAVHPSGKFAYEADCGEDSEADPGVSMYAINTSTGTLTSMGFIDAGDMGPFPTSVAIDPSGKFAYVANEAAFSFPQPSGNVSMYTIDSTTGALRSTGTVVAGKTPVSVAVDPSGKFAYVANRDSGDVSMYTINPTTGALTLIGTIGP